MNTSLRLYLLGKFRLERLDGTVVLPVHLPTRKEKSLLAYLALFPGPHSREQMAALLWGDTSDKNARVSLRQALSHLRKALGETALLADLETIQLNPALALRSDVQAFQSALDALKTDGTFFTESDLMPGLPAADLLLDFYDEWILPVRESLRVRQVEALLSASAQARAQQRYAQALDLAQVVLRLDTANEPAHQSVMSCYVALGDTAAAFRQYAACRQALQMELGVEPSHETKLWYETLRRTAGTHILHARRTNLPEPLTSFVGREREQSELAELLVRTPLLSLTGVGGAGKTRLAIELGQTCLDKYAGGVWWVELAPLADGSLVPKQVANALGIEENPQEPLMDTLLHFLRTRTLLLVLDNCEHLLDACAQLAEMLLSACPGLTILTTSREDLNLPGEQVYRVTPLDVPHTPISTLAQLALEFSAVQLFVERARLAQSHFELNDENALAIVQICQRVDGIPLALELAAARVKEMSVPDLAAHLESSFEVLVGTRTAQPRQKTLHALIDWSHNLLTTEERVLFRRVSVFAGGWTLSTLGGVLSETDDTPGAAIPFRVLSGLVDKSLVVADVSGGETRYTLLETVREYALAKLEFSGEMQVMQKKHCAYFVQLAERTAYEIKGMGGKAGLRRLEIEHNNLRAALRWALRNDPSESGLRLTAVLGWFWHVHSHFTEGRDWAEKMLTAAPQKDTLMYARALSAAGTIAWSADDFLQAHVHHEQALVLFRQYGTPSDIAFTLTNLIVQANYRGDFSQSMELAASAVQFARAGTDSWVLAHALLNEGANYLMNGQPAPARPALEEGLGVARACQHRQIIGYLQDNMGDVCTYEQKYAQADAAYQEAVAIADEIEDHWAMAGARRDWARSLLQRGDALRAQPLFAATLKLVLAMGRRSMTVDALEGIGLCQAVLDPAPRVARLLGAIDTLRARLNYPREYAFQEINARLTAALRQHLGAAVMTQESCIGSTLTLEEVLALQDLGRRN